MAKIIGIIGSYREGGVNDQIVTEILAGAAEAGAETRRIFLPEADIQFCTNCRSCMQEPGDAPGKCVINDAMTELLPELIKSDAIVLASPQNVGAVTAVFKRFTERLAPLAYWPFGANGPKAREGIIPKRGIIVLTSAAPTFVWRLGGFTAETTVRNIAKMLKIKKLRVLKYGLMSREQYPTLTEAQRAKARNSGRQLAEK